MNRQIHLTDLAADDQLLDRLGARSDVGGEPVAVLLAALARHADNPLRTGPAPRRFTRRRTLTALTALVVGASGAGVAAAVTQPQGWLTRGPSRVSAFEAAPRPAVSQPGLSQLTLSAVPAPVVASDGYVLVRDAAGQIVLLPPKVVVEVPAAAPEPVVDLAAEPVADQADAAPGPDAQVASWTVADEADQQPTPVSASGSAKAKPAPAEQPGKSKPRAPVDPVSTDESLALAAQPVDTQPPGLSIAAALRPSTPGTESGAGVPARPGKPDQARDPQKPEQAETPEQAQDPGKPGSVEDLDHPEQPDPSRDAGEPGEPAQPPDRDKPADPGKPTEVGKPSETDGRDQPSTPAHPVTVTPLEPAHPEPAGPTAQPEHPAQPQPAAEAGGAEPAGPAATPKGELPAEPQAPVTVELPSVPAAPVDAPPAQPTS